MGLFTKKQNKETTPKLPDLPKLPQLSNNSQEQKKFSFEEDDFPTRNFPESNRQSKEIHELPTFPKNDLSDKFSQNSIKSAVSGKKDEITFPEEEMEDFDFEEELPPMEEPIKLKPQLAPIPKMPERKPIIPSPNIERERQRIESDEPVFIRIDKFEESLKIFDKIKTKISEMEILLKETKQLKEKEEEELSNWEQEVQKLKMHIEKVDRDVFSKID